MKSYLTRVLDKKIRNGYITLETKVVMWQKTLWMQGLKARLQGSHIDLTVCALFGMRISTVLKYILGKFLLLKVTYFWMLNLYQTTNF